LNLPDQKYLSTFFLHFCSKIENIFTENISPKNNLSALYFLQTDFFRLICISGCKNIFTCLAETQEQRGIERDDLILLKSENLKFALCPSERGQTNLPQALLTI
jgi:hypothetical protein